MAAIKTTDLASNSIKLDLSDELSTLVSKQPTFLNLFPQKGIAKAPKHEWLEDVLRPKESAYASATAVGVFTFATAAGATAFAAGDLVAISGKSALLKVTAVSGTDKTVTTSFLTAGGSGLTSETIPTAAGTLQFVSHPVSEASSSGREIFRQSSRAYNYTQILRAGFVLSGTNLATDVYGNENSIAAQSAHALLDVARELDKIALFGFRCDGADDVRRCGGLYEFGTANGCASIDATPSSTANPLSLKYINDAAQEILDDGGTPDVILVGNGQKRVLSQIMRSQISYSPSDSTRGGTVDKIVCELTGGTMRIVVDPNIVDSDAWVIDSSGFGLCPMNGRWGKLEDVTEKGFDGIRYSILAEFSLNFKNATSRLCRIMNLKSSSASLT